MLIEYNRAATARLYSSTSVHTDVQPDGIDWRHSGVRVTSLVNVIKPEIYSNIFMPLTKPGLLVDIIISEMCEYYYIRSVCPSALKILYETLIIEYCEFQSGLQFNCVLGRIWQINCEQPHS